MPDADPVSAPEDAAPLYYSLGADAYRLIELDGLCALFDRRSGQTHLVASPVPELLAMMGEIPRNVHMILADLSTQFELPPGEDHTASLTARLDELAALGLVGVQR